MKSAEEVASLLASVEEQLGRVKAEIAHCEERRILLRDHLHELFGLKTAYEGLLVPTGGGAV